MKPTKQLSLLFNLYIIIQQSTAYRCVKEYRSDNDVINSYDVSSYCQFVEYKIRLFSRNNMVSLEWLDFDVDGDMPWCLDDSLEVYTGCYIRKKIATLCSNNMKSLPHKIISTDNCMTIKLNRHKNSPSSFRAKFESYYEYNQSPCRLTSSTDANGIVTSPNWPSKYAANEVCSFNIKVPHTNLIQINFMDLNLEYFSSCYEFVKFQGRNTHESHHVCRKSEISSYILNDHEVNITYKSLSSGKGSFALGWLTYTNPQYANTDHEDDQHKKGSSRYSTFFILPSMAVVFVIVFITVRRRQRLLMLQRNQQHNQQQHQAYNNCIRYLNQQQQQQTHPPQEQQSREQNTFDNDYGKINHGMEYPGQPPYFLPPPPYPGPPPVESYNNGFELQRIMQSSSSAVTAPPSQILIQQPQPPEQLQQPPEQFQQPSQQLQPPPEQLQQLPEQLQQLPEQLQQLQQLQQLPQQLQQPQGQFQQPLEQFQHPPEQFQHPPEQPPPSYEEIQTIQITPYPGPNQAS